MFIITDVQMFVNSTNSFEAVGSRLHIILTNLDENKKFLKYSNNKIGLNYTTWQQLTIMIRNVPTLEDLREFKK